MRIINVFHKKMTDEEIYGNLKRIKANQTFMSAALWKKLRLKQLMEDGRTWSKVDGL